MEACGSFCGSLTEAVVPKFSEGVRGTAACDPILCGRFAEAFRKRVFACKGIGASLHLNLVSVLLYTRNTLTHTCTSAPTHTCIETHNTQTHTHAQTDTQRTDTRTHTQTHTHTRTHTHTHTHTHKQVNAKNPAATEACGSFCGSLTEANTFHKDHCRRVSETVHMGVSKKLCIRFFSFLSLIFVWPH